MIYPPKVRIFKEPGGKTAIETLIYGETFTVIFDESIPKAFDAALDSLIEMMTGGARQKIIQTYHEFRTKL